MQHSLTHLKPHFLIQLTYELEVLKEKHPKGNASFFHILDHNGCMKEAPEILSNCFNRTSPPIYSSNLETTKRSLKLYVSLLLLSPKMMVQSSCQYKKSLQADYSLDYSSVSSPQSGYSSDYSSDLTSQLCRSSGQRDWSFGILFIFLDL
ncbi:uncharacterized protein LOC111467073 [Cucurbita maxima]|uniref:Uncharacterized protein LOC111467073 n=1 Tax=Cucurbita maxima TaxID=3661 RepID=A0A6J1HRC3_CUCMA|nr:uncharacterized protein LOC111467073 [Cucurbita maxima]